MYVKENPDRKKKICQLMLLNLSRYYAVPLNDFKETYKWKNQFSGSITGSNILNDR